MNTNAAAASSKDAEETTRDRKSTEVKGKGQSKRSVTVLSSGQLARKRAADRAAQRVRRQRTRERIEQLEDRLKQLSDGKIDGTAIEAVQRRNLKLEKEVKRLKAIQKSREEETNANLTRNSQLECPNDSVFQVPTPPRDPEPNNPEIPPTKAYSWSNDEVVAAQLASLGRTSLGPDSSHDKSVPTDTTAYIASQLVNAPRQKSALSGPSVPGREVYSGTHLPPPRNEVKEPSKRGCLERVFENAALRPQSSHPTSFIRQPSIHEWEIPLNVIQPTSPIESILYGMVQHQRSLATKGVTGRELAGPRFPNLNALFIPEHTGPVQAVAKFISELLNRITYRTLVDKLGAFMVMYPIYQWQIMQSRESYSDLSPYLRPLLSQRTTPHPIWICAIGFPKLRKLVIENQEKYTTEEFQFLFVASINVNWPHGIEDALCRRNGVITVTKEFWDHTRKLENWSMDEPFQTRYPELRDYCKFTEYPGKNVGSGSLAIPLGDESSIGKVRVRNDI